MAKNSKISDEKTNVMRILEQNGIEYTSATYPHEEGKAVDGKTVANFLSQDPDSVFKTLVTRGSSGNYYVFDIPVSGELDLKKAAKAVSEKNIAMIKVSELLPLTGYIRGGCSPIGMKKQFFTTIDETAILFDNIAISAGKIGSQVILSPEKLAEFIGGQFKDVIKDF